MVLGSVRPNGSVHFGICAASTVVISPLSGVIAHVNALHISSNLPRASFDRAATLDAVVKALDAAAAVAVAEEALDASAVEGGGGGGGWGRHAGVHVSVDRRPKHRRYISSSQAAVIGNSAMTHNPRPQKKNAVDARPTNK